MNAFETLLDLEKNCKAHAVNLPRQIISERNGFGISFKASGFHFVCAMDQVSEVLKWPSFTELPSSRSWFRGAANLRGRLLPISDLQGFVSGIPHQAGMNSRVLVIPFKSYLYGFAVEQVLGIEHFFKDEKKSATEIPDIGAYLPYAKEAFEHAEQPWILFDFEAVFANPNFYHVLSSRMELGH